jgi:hypothetical protein
VVASFRAVSLDEERMMIYSIHIASDLPILMLLFCVSGPSAAVSGEGTPSIAAVFARRSLTTVGALVPERLEPVELNVVDTSRVGSVPQRVPRRRVQLIMSSSLVARSRR